MSEKSEWVVIDKEKKKKEKLKQKRVENAIETAAREKQRLEVLSFLLLSNIGLIQFKKEKICLTLD